MVAKSSDKITTIVTVDSLHPSKEKLLPAVDLINSGNVVAFPTETVYGLGADATDNEAVSKIYTIKNRPADNPLIAHFSDIEDIYPYVSDFPEIAQELAEIFWPGPLTMVMKKTDKIADNVTQNLDTVAIRIPAHPVALLFIELCGVPLAAPSANLSGKPSPTTADHVFNDLQGKLDMIIDGGSTSIGVESTVINLTTSPPTLLRPGGITIEELQSVIPNMVIPQTLDEQQDETPLSPGMKYTHYSPDTRLVLLDHAYDLGVEQIEEVAKSQAKDSIILCTNSDHNHTLPTIRVGDTLKEIQINLFASLRLLDNRPNTIGIFEAVKPENEGYTVMNRVKKAAHDIINIINS